MSQQLLEYRKTSQKLPPVVLKPATEGGYGLYPSSCVPSGSIDRGFKAIAEKVSGFQTIRIDGFGGVFWEEFRKHLQASLAEIGVESKWINVSHALKQECEINRIADPCLGGDDPLFGKRFAGKMIDLFDRQQLDSYHLGTGSFCTIIYGCGAGLFTCDGPLFYVDLPKSEVQFRSRAGTIGNLGISTPTDPRATYKRFFFFDWPILNRHKAAIIRQVDWFIDEQRPDEPSIMSGEHLREALNRVSTGVFRAKPWFEPGPWGGQRIKQLIPDLPQEVANYAWSFELITPENGLLFSDGQQWIEVSFDWAMYHNAREILGDHEPRFGYDFPIRFNFLDTFEGGNLSIQCHPQTEYIQKHFGEPFTQDECYYIIDCKPESKVFLGFAEDIDPAKFSAELKYSFTEETEMDVDRYLNSESTQKHDLFLIPGGTVHSSGINNLVLEISATTYIYTFKVYDWQRMDLDGKPRTLNIDRALENLQFDRKGDRVAREFVSHPVELARGDDWRLVHLPTHDQHFYDVHRFEFDTEVESHTEGSPHVLSLVEGSSVAVETKSGMRQQFNYAETFVIPAAAESYRLINVGQQRAMVVKAFIKSLSTT
ncbi:MAG: class I mannose-6-phosphate isomerase [Pirellulales bacterium]